MIYTSFDNYPIEHSLYGQFITYDELRNIISNEYANDNYSQTINVFIDVYQFLMIGLRYKKINDPYSIAASIINYAAHIRRYFKIVHGMYSNIVLIYTTNDSENTTKFLPEYNAYYKNRKKANPFMWERIQNNMKLVRVLVPYIPDVFLKEGSVESSVMIHDFIQNHYVGRHPNLIISNSQMMYQLPQFSRSAVILRKDLGPTATLNKTFSYNIHNCVEAYCYEITKLNLTDIKINQQTISFTMALRGIPRRSITSLYAIKTVLKMADQIPLGCEHDPDVWYEICTHKKSKKYITKEMILNRYKAIDLGYQYKLYKTLPESKERKFLEQLNDKESVQEINTRYLAKSPLNLEEL